MATTPGGTRPSLLGAHWRFSNHSHASCPAPEPAQTVGGRLHAGRARLIERASCETDFLANTPGRVTDLAPYCRGSPWGPAVV